MTKEQRTQTELLRKIGKSYRAIATELNVPLSTIQSYCRSRGLTGNRTSNVGSFCEQCGKELIQTEEHKKKRFCSDVCRQKWWYQHRDSMKHKKTVKVKCHTCGSVFESYKGANRKYCSINCYIADRFGKGEPLREQTN